MKFTKMLLFVAAMLLLLSSCGKTVEQKVFKNSSLKDSYKNTFYIGTALAAKHIDETDTLVAALIAREYSSITAENVMKSKFMHPEKEVYNFTLSDKFVALAEKNKMHAHGHTLIWHSQLATWIEAIKDSTEMVNVMEDHITTIVGKYKDRIASWDVVNEALNEDGSLRESVFYKTIGEDYLVQAFKLAAKADPNTDLYYNDYNMTNQNKREGAINMIKNIKDKGGKVDGIGMQGHWGLETPSIEDIEKSIIEYSKLGVKVAITELDITVLPNPWDLVGADVNQNFEGSEKMNPYPKSLPNSIQIKLANRYQDIFKLFIKHKDKISRVTFWGVNDSHSWLNDWPIKGRTNYPLLFNRDFKPKKAYDSIIALKVK